jgi:hypothetical protein
MYSTITRRGPFVVLLVLAALFAVYRYLGSRVELLAREMQEESSVHGDPTKRPLDPQREAAWLASQRSSAGATTPLPDDDSVVTLTRRGCMGSCPAYSVSIYRSGRVEFAGDRWVCTPRPSPIVIDRGAVAQLVNGLKAVSFDTMPSYTWGHGGDGPAATITFRRQNVAHQVDHEIGDFAAPRLLDWIEKRIDEVSGTAVWLPTHEGYRLTCVLPDGTKQSCRPVDGGHTCKPIQGIRS